jgi:hypothetical protein
MTKHCAQFKQAVLQILLSGSYSNKNTAKKSILCIRIEFIFCELFLISDKK